MTRYEKTLIVDGLRLAVKADKRARRERDKTIRQASRKGLTYREIARAAGLSLGRIQQIVRSK